MQILLTHDGITPDLARKLKAASDRRGIHQAMGLAVVALTKRAFNDASLRPGAWKAKASGQPATLRKSGTLAKSIRVVSASQDGVVVGSDRRYAAIHQLGGKTPAHVIRPKTKKALKTPFGVFKKVSHPGSNIPARPFFPFFANGRPTPQALRAIDSVIKAKIDAKA
jgi:phage gpG-like protein